VQNYPYLMGLGSPNMTATFCGACYNQGEKVVGGGWYADTTSVLILASTSGVSVGPRGQRVDAWCLAVTNLMQTAQDFVLFANCASGLPPGSTVSEVWGDYSSIHANALSPAAQVDCPSGSTATSAAFYTANASAFTLSELTLGATGTSALGAFLNTSSTDMQAQIGAVCLSAAGASTAVAGSGTYWDPGDGVTVRAGVSCPTGGVNTGGGWLFQNDISVYLPIYQSSDASYPNGWTTWVYRGGYDRDSWPTVQAFCLTVP
jgi:hypothetical protein